MKDTRNQTNDTTNKQSSKRNTSDTSNQPYLLCTIGYTNY